MLSLVLLCRICYGNCFKELFSSLLPGGVPPFSECKSTNFSYNTKAFRLFSYKKANFFQIKEGTQYYIYARAYSHKDREQEEGRDLPNGFRGKRARSGFQRANNSKMLLE